MQSGFARWWLQPIVDKVGMAAEGVCRRTPHPLEIALDKLSKSLYISPPVPGNVYK